MRRAAFVDPGLCAEVPRLPAEESPFEKSRLN